MSWIDDVWVTFTSVAGDTAGLVDAVINLPWILVDLIFDILLAIIYPFILAVNYVLIWVDYGLQTFWNFIDAFFTLSGVLQETLATFLDIFPSPWVLLLMSIVTLRVALRVYFFVRDISLAGFKI